MEPATVCDTDVTKITDRGRGAGTLAIVER